MTGPEHYQAAEDLLAMASNADDVLLVARAQVHATLALAAATALNAVGRWPAGAPYATAWNDATGLPS